MKSGLIVFVAALWMGLPSLAHADLSVFDRATCIESLKGLSPQAFDALKAEFQGLSMEVWCPQFLQRKKSASIKQAPEAAPVQEAETQGSAAAS